MFRNKTDEAEISIITGHTFEDKKLLLCALTRTSAINEGLQAPKIGDFQRLEFLGDKVLNLVVSGLLFEYHPDWSVGKLTEETAKYVNNKGPLATVAHVLKLDKFLIVGAGEENLRINKKILSDAVEALLGAMWIDSKNNYALMREFIRKHWVCLGLKPDSERYDVKVRAIQDYNLSNSERIDNIGIFFESKPDKETIGKLLKDMRGDDPEVIEAILSHSSDQAILDAELVECVEDNFENEAALLLKYKANPNAVVQKKLGNKTSVLQHAISASYPNVAIIRSLLTYGAKPNWNEGVSVTMSGVSSFLVHELAESVFSVMNPESSGDEFGVGLSDLMAMSQKEKEREKNRQLYDNKRTALHYLALNTSIEDSDGGKELVALLMEFKADIDLQDSAGNTALHLALQSGTRYTIANTLLSSGANGFVKNKKGETPFSLAGEIMGRIIVRSDQDDLSHLLSLLAFESSEADGSVENETQALNTKDKSVKVNVASQQEKSSLPFWNKSATGIKPIADKKTSQVKGMGRVVT